MLNVVMLNVTMLSVIMLNVVAPILAVGVCIALLRTKKEKPLMVLLKRPIGE
jgi:hypothetical protein